MPDGVYHQSFLRNGSLRNTTFDDEKLGINEYVPLGTSAGYTHRKINQYVPLGTFGVRMN